MQNQPAHSRKIQAQLQALSNEIQQIRGQFGPAIHESNRLRTEASRLNAAAIANDTYISRLLQRLERAESTQHQLLEHVARAAPQMTAPSQSYNSYGTVASSLPPPPPIPSAYGMARRQGNPPAPPPGLLLPAGCGSSSSGGPAAFANPSSPTTPRASAMRMQPTQSQQQHRSQTVGSQANADFLPMVVEAILASRKRYERQGTLAPCNFVLETQGNMVRKCRRHGFDIKCFREDHFNFCGKHMRVIPGNNLACSHPGKGDCVLIYWEDRDDWEKIVDAALAAGNLERSVVDSDELKEALFSPRRYPHQYLS